MTSPPPSSPTATCICCWRWRRNAAIVIITSFLALQWSLRLWFSPSLLAESSRAPKPFSAWTTSRNLLNDVPPEGNVSLGRGVPQGGVLDSLGGGLSQGQLGGIVSGTFLESDEQREFLSSWKATMDERTRRVRQGCDKYGLILKRFNNHLRLLFDTKHHIAYCKNAKAGTTTWLSDLLAGVGVNTTGLTPEDIHEEAKRAFPPLPPKVAAMEMDNLSLLFTVVRHPFTRLVSAYRDKIPENYRADLQQKMIEQYRTVFKKGQPEQKQGNDQPRVEDPFLPTFREFALFVTDQIVACKPHVNSACLEQIDPHWRPIHDRCAPCDLRYDVIAKVETFHEDQRYIRVITGLSDQSAKERPNSGLLPPHAHASSGPSSAELTKKYFSSLNNEEKQRIYEAYFFDFYLFGYSPDVIV
ncbi:carbohydrate sulfotransferase 11-like [Macrobrachium rosenbergii]|uniref:carbohydrate sulfotransferase 11-like n=1 Tax=Macrobrachium rosenbergii TaxID=79674 RepID=UPI0034D4CCF8